MTDLEIIDLYHHRSEEAISETAKQYGHLLYKIANDILRNHQDSEETVNDTYIGAWNAMPPQRPNALCAFLARIARNTAISRYRKHHAQCREGILVELSDVETHGTEEAFDLHALTASIEQFLRKLSKSERVLFVKRYFFAVSIQELAQEAGCTDAKIVSRLYRLRQKLKAKLEQEGYAL